MRRLTLAGLRKRLSGAFRLGYVALRSPNGVPAGYHPPESPENFPAGMKRWAAKHDGKIRRDYPPAWRHQLEMFRVSPKPRLAVVMHVYYGDLLPELLQQIKNINVPFDLIITNATGRPLRIALDDHLASDVQVFDVPNRGRDILPLVMLVNANVLSSYELVLKIHTKKSEWRQEHAELSGDGESWRDSLLSSLLGSEENVSQILDSFAANPNLGIVTSDDSVLGAEFWGGDRAIAAAILRRVQLDIDHLPLSFAAGSMYWIRAFVLQGLQALNLQEADFEEEAGQVDGTTAHAIERLIGMLALEAGYHLAERSGLEEISLGEGRRYWIDQPRVPRARVLPFYLPQFHSFPENDLWWGEGFTEWSNVTSAKPVFLGHAQPLLPSSFGFYNLLHDETRIAQYKLAEQHGVEGFMYYYYWFAGKALMNRPIEMLHGSDDTTPFCIMWANENWTRRWDGGEGDVLIGQDYDSVPASEFIRDVAHLLADPRYVRVDGRPLLAVYRITQLPDYEAVIAEWREYARGAGLGELFILVGDVGVAMQGLDGDPRPVGVDGSFQFPPHNMTWASQNLSGLEVDHRFSGGILSYSALARDAETAISEALEDWQNPGVMVGFDNSARRQWESHIWYGSNPYTFRRWVDRTLSALATREPEQRMLFVNAWNEWAESAVLEPSVRFGSTYLQALRDALMR